MTKPLILFVDDEPNMLNGLRRFTRKRRDEWDTLFVERGQDALEVIQSMPVDVLVADMRMPGMDGATLVGRAAAESPDSVLMILSGESVEEQTYLTIGRSHRFVAKPCQPDALIADIARVLRWRSVAGGAIAGNVFDRLTSPKAVHDRLRDMLGQDEWTLDEAGELIASDPNLAIRILQLVNSAYFGAPVETLSIRRAVQMIGLDRLRGLSELGRLGGNHEPGEGPDPDIGARAWAAKDQVLAAGGAESAVDLAYTAVLFSGFGDGAACITAMLGLPPVLSDCLAELAKPDGTASLESRACAFALAQTHQDQERVCANAG